MTSTHADLWTAPVADSALDATVAVPGSKSLSNRYLVLAALADGPSTLRSLLVSRDTRLMAAALGTLGVQVDLGGDDVRVTPAPLHGHVTVDCGLAQAPIREPRGRVAQYSLAVSSDTRTTGPRKCTCRCSAIHGKVAAARGFACRSRLLSEFRLV